MPKKALKLDQIGYWSELKLDIIRKYAAAYSKILAANSQIRGHIYVDGFAGAGTHVSKATGQMVAGSPLNAASLRPGFTELHLIDLDGSRTTELRRLTADDPRVTVHDGDCNAILLDRVFPKCRYEDFRRALCVLDPYGLSVNWEVMRVAGKMESVEVFYNFMIMDANMNVFMRNPDSVDPDQASRMTSTWGDESWRGVVYETTRDLFGDRETKTSNEAIAGAFRERLREVAGFSYVPEPIPMRNSKGAVVYYLYFASPNKTGARIVADIFDAYRNRGAS